MPWSVRFDPIILGLPIVDFPTASQWSHLLLLESPCPFFCLFVSDVFSRFMYNATKWENSHIIPFFSKDGITMMFTMIIMTVILMIMIAKITKNIQIL